MIRKPTLWLLCVFLAASCSSNSGGNRPPTPITDKNHTFFPITPGSTHALDRQGLAIDGPMTCESCHPTTLPGGEADAGVGFDQPQCINCHTHEKPITDRLHQREPLYSFNTRAPGAGSPQKGCLNCHPAGEAMAYDHFGITNQCAECHDIGTAFAALPKPNFTHPNVGASDCGGCHVTTTWLDAGLAPNDAHDPARDVTVTALQPTWAGTSITRVTPQTQVLPMMMNHSTLQVPAATLSACGNCHQGAGEGAYYPGSLHSALANLDGGVQPSQCNECHKPSMPTGFIGPTATAPARTPASGEMRHEAVAWLNGAPGAAKLAAFDCAVCHAPPDELTASTWANDRTRAGAPAKFHAALRTAGKPPVGSCIDCHANTRPNGVVTVAPLNIAFDHDDPTAQGDCQSCHAASAATNASWAGGVFHPAGSAAPATCLPCHAAERPATTAGWIKPNFSASPFDYGTNSAGIEHGAGLDCATCHANPGTGAWGGTQNWAGGAFTHGPATLSASTCSQCHTTQRPDLLPGLDAGTAATLIGFDHAANGTGDCFGCHQATVTANAYVNLYNPATGKLPNGDWKGGQLYPGSVLASSPAQKIQVTSYALTKSGSMITGLTSSNVTLFNAMLHTSSVLPAALNAGPSNAPEYTKCWHCHTNTNGVVTAYSNGKYHASLTNYRATPTGAVVPFGQPTNQCLDCHAQMRPPGIVEKAASTLQPMDHGQALAQIECATCHRSPGTSWADGAYHPNLGAAAPADCTVCHYPLMADAPKADVAVATTFSMKHRSPQITFQACQNCHSAALAKATTAPLAAPLWKTGNYHPALTAQPAACVDCHAISDPTTFTASSVQYPLLAGATATNKQQYMNHASGAVAGKDCVTCHASDAKKVGAAWSKATSFHAAVTNPATCRECHGTTNGGGAVIGTNNNLPLGLTTTTTVTTASAATGVSGVRDQISHADLNVSGRDCAACHTQKGPSSAAGLQGKEWAQAKFHVNFNGTTPLISNGTTARCSTCHLNVKPGAGYTLQNHSAYTAASGTTDCSACHSYPGTGTVAAGNWLGAVGGVPTFIPVGGFTIPVPPATTATVQSGIANLPHPTVGVQACTACHTTAAGGKNAIGYDHKSTLINANCNSCHETGSNLIGTPWNNSTTTAGGAGDTRPYTINSLVPTFKNNNKSLANNKHFFPINCYECHRAPTTGNALVTTGAAYTAVWRFKHSEGAPMTKPSTCNTCHNFGIPK